MSNALEGSKLNKCILTVIGIILIKQMNYVLDHFH